MANESAKELVLVTGGSGYLAGWMIVGLLRSGYRVRTTLRHVERQHAIRTAVATVADSTERLSFVQADLFSDSGWDAAMKDVSYVAHVASPMGQGQPKADLVTPAMGGTLRVLAAAARQGVKRVVYTSSTITVKNGENTPADENLWADAFRKDFSEYGRSKILAERAAWDFIEKDRSGLSLTTVLPGMILGRLLNSQVSGSVELIYRLLTGKIPAIPRIGFAVSETEALVDLHLRAMAAPQAANQRLLGVGDFLWIDDMAATLREQYPENMKIPKKHLPDFVLRAAALFQHEARFMAPMLNKRSEYDVSKADRLLGWRPGHSMQAVLNCARSIIEHGLA